MKRHIIAIALALTTLTGCSTLQALGIGGAVATNVSTITPSQVTTLAAADLAADAIVKLTTTAVDTGKLDAGTLNEIQALRGGVRTALDALHAAQAKGQSLVFASLNAAIDAYHAYAISKGITS